MSDSTVSAKLSADASDYKSALNDAAEFTGGIAGKIGHHFTGTRFIAHALSTALALDWKEMAANIGREIIGFSEDYEKALKRVEQGSKESADRSIAYMHSLLGAEQKYILALNERDAALARIKKNAPRQTEPIEESYTSKAQKALAVFLFSTGQKSLVNLGNIIAARHEEVKALEHTVALQKEGDTVTENAALIHAHDLEVTKRKLELEKIKRQTGMDQLTDAGKLRQINTEIAAITKEIAAGGDAKRNDEDLYVKLQSLEVERAKEMALIKKASSLTMSEEHEKLLLEAKGVGNLSDAEHRRYEVLKLIVKERGKESEIEGILAIPLKDRTEAQKAHLKVLIQQTKEIEKQIDLIANPPIPTPPPLVETIKSYIDEWDKFTIAVSGKGRGNKDLSDAELKRKIATTRADISQRELSLNRQSGIGPSAPFDALLGPQQTNLQRALDEMRLRSDTRRNALAFGQAQAFQMNPGLTEQRFQQILSGMSPGDTTRLANAMEKLNRHFDRGVPFVFSQATGTQQAIISPGNG